MMLKDNILTLKVPGANLVFTRYLYIKDEVKTALLISILNKSDDAIFWAYELYYSGYKNELYAFIWQIYYDFFATLNPSFAVYLSKKLSNQKDIDDRLISSIIQNLLIRSYNTDIFLLRTISEVFEEAEAKEEEEAVEDLLETKNYRKLASYILLNKTDLELEETYKKVLNYFKLTNQKRATLSNATRNTSVSKQIILLAYIMSLFNTEAQNLVKKKNFYVRVDPEEVVQYETIEATDLLKPYRILAQACVCKIQNNWVNLFQGFRNQTSPLEKEKYNKWSTRAAVEKYSDNWLYHAAFSPEWFARIRSYKGYVDYQNQQVKFVSEEWEDAFYSKFNYDPDEQPLFVKENALKLIKSDTTSTWQQFFAKYKRCGLIDALTTELDALNEEPLKY
jgi:hypothetical protein